MVDTYIKGSIRKEVLRPVNLVIPINIKFTGVISNTRYILAAARPGAILKPSAFYIKKLNTNNAASTTATIQLVGNLIKPGDTTPQWFVLSNARPAATGKVLPDKIDDVTSVAGGATNVSIFSNPLLGNVFAEIGLDVVGGTAVQDTEIELEIGIIGFEIGSFEEFSEPTKTVEYGKIGLGQDVKIDVNDPNGTYVLKGTPATAITASIYNY